MVPFVVGAVIVSVFLNIGVAAFDPGNLKLNGGGVKTMLRASFVNQNKTLYKILTVTVILWARLPHYKCGQGVISKLL